MASPKALKCSEILQKKYHNCCIIPAIWHQIGWIQRFTTATLEESVHILMFWIFQRADTDSSDGILISSQSYDHLKPPHRYAVLLTCQTMETLPTIPMAFEIEIHMQDASLKCALKPFLVRVFPFLVHYAEGNVFIRRTSMEADQACFSTTTISLDGICWCLCLIHKIWVEDIEFVALHNLWRWIVMVIMSLIVLVPLISCVDSVEILRLPWPVLIMPPINL
jgi:hypothetical protein